MKKCRICEQEKDLSQFYPRRDSKDGYRNECKPCQDNKSNLYYKQNRDQQLQYRLDYYQANKTQMNQNSAAWRAANPERKRELDLRYAAEHRDEARQRAKQWRLDHPERKAAMDRAWKAANPEKWKETHDNCVARRRLWMEAQFVEKVSKRVLWERDAHACQLCAKPLTYQEATIDHVIPISRRGDHSYANTQIACWPCNASKRDKLPENKVVAC